MNYNRIKKQTKEKIESSDDGNGIQREVVIIIINNIIGSNASFHFVVPPPIKSIMEIL